MNKEYRNTKKEILKITREIDMILFDESDKPNKLKLSDLFIGAETAFGACAAGVLLDTNMAYQKLTLSITALAFLLGVKIAYDIRDTGYGFFDYAFSFRDLPQEEQIKVLKLSRYLVDIYKEKNLPDKTKNYIKNYLDYDGKNTMFEIFYKKSLGESINQEKPFVKKLVRERKPNKKEDQ